MEILNAKIMIKESLHIKSIDQIRCGCLLCISKSLGVEEWIVRSLAGEFDLIYEMVTGKLNGFVD